MAKFLTRKGITHHIDDIIRKADERLVLISPFIDADDDTKDLLRNKRRGTPIHVIYGKEDLKPEVRKEIEGLGVTLLFRKNLHAKCYLNEHMALITSMNLYEFSQKNNDEMGILVDRQEDPVLYADILEEVERLKNTRPEPVVGSTRERKSQPVNPRQVRQLNKVAVKTGHCIRCNDSIKLAVEAPFCPRCYSSWNRSKNRAYQEKYCHGCGRQYSTTMARPLCLDCYRKPSASTI